LSIGVALSTYLSVYLYICPYAEIKLRLSMVLGDKRRELAAEPVEVMLFSEIDLYSPQR
jgi:hypothetical protein